MFRYQKILTYPVNIKKKDLPMAKLIITQFGGPAGQLGAALEYLTQRFTMPDDKGRTLLTDIGNEELGHIEMICTMVKQLLKGATVEELKEAGLESHYAEHGLGLFPVDSNGIPFSVNFTSSGDPITDLADDIAAEEYARTTYDHLIDLTDDPDLINPLLFLRQREVVHLHRFKELYNEYKEQMKK